LAITPLELLMVPTHPTQPLSLPRGNGMWPIFPQTGIPALMQDPRTGVVFQNPAHDMQKWYWLFVNASSPHVTIPVNSAGVSAAFSPGLDDGTLGDFEIVKFNSTYDASLRRTAVRMRDAFLDRWLMNNPVDADFVFGTTEYPGQLFESIFVPASVSLEMYFYDIYGAQVITCPTAQGRRFMGCQDRAALWHSFQERRTHPYWLTLDQATTGQVTVLAGETEQFTMTVPAGADFEAWSLMDDTCLASDNTTPAEYTIRMFEGMSGRSLFGTSTPEAVEISNVAAKTRQVTGVSGNRLRAVGNPNMLTFTHKLPGRTQIQVEVTAGGSDLVVRLAIHGRLIYAQKCVPNAPVDLLQQSVAYMPVPGASCFPNPCGAQGGAPVPMPMQFPPGGQLPPGAFLGPGYGAAAAGPGFGPGVSGFRR
jgi:hypothetical protein